MNWYLVALKKYAVFAGRARRKEFWFFVLFNTLIAVALAVIDMLTGTFDEDVGLGLLSGLYAVAMILPSIAVTVRRLHDTDRSGWWYLLVFLPVIGGLVILVFMSSTVRRAAIGSGRIQRKSRARACSRRPEVVATSLRLRQLPTSTARGF